MAALLQSLSAEAPSNIPASTRQSPTPYAMVRRAPAAGRTQGASACGACQPARGVSASGACVWAWGEGA
eukprot:6135514-Prymnesium_polylepis.1